MRALRASFPHFIDMIIFKLLPAWQLEADFLKTALLYYWHKKIWVHNHLIIKIILSLIVWKNFGLCFTELIYIWKLINTYGCFNLLSKFYNAVKGKIYRVFSSRSEYVKCNRHNTAFNSFEFHLDHQLIVSFKSPLNYISFAIVVVLFC